MKRRIIVSVFTLLIGIMVIGNFAGCKKFVQISPPIDQLVTKSVFANDALAVAAVNGVYTQMQSESFNMARSTGLLSDELVAPFSQDLSIQQYYLNSMSPTNGNAGPWGSAYSYIFQVNSILAALEGSDGIHPGVGQQLRGESLFIRAFWLFYLTNCYGDVPLVTSSDYTVNALIARSKQEKVYQQIVTDLEEAQGLLNVNFVAANDTSISIDRVRPNKWSAKALLSRVYLYLKQYNKAFNNANEVIGNNALFGLVNNLDSVFLANSKEALWQLGVPTPTTVNTVDGNRFIILQVPYSGSAQLLISPFLLNAFDSIDKRRSQWIGTFTDPITGNIYSFPQKYKVSLSNSIKENTMMLRLAEQYLIRAEANVQLNNIDAGIADLMMIRHRAGLGDYEGTKDKDNVMQDILMQRRLEFFTEWGHRWFDLVRTNTIDGVMSQVAPVKGGIWNPNKKLFPLPQSELNIDVNLIQNIGY